MGSSYRVLGNLLETTFQRNTIFLLQQTPVDRRHGAELSIFPLGSGISIGLFLCRSSAGNHSCWVFSEQLPCLVQGASLHSAPPHPRVLTFILPLLQRRSPSLTCGDGGGGGGDTDVPWMEEQSQSLLSIWNNNEKLPKPLPTAIQSFFDQN